MRKLSARATAALTNLMLVFILLCVGTVCLYPTSSEVSKIEDGVYARGFHDKGVSLMFNVYWGTEEVTAILDILDEYQAKATFFVGGCWADDNVTTVKEIAQRGHELGSHGYFHRDHDKLSYAQNYEEIKTSVDFINRATEGEIKLFAPPSGAYNADTVRACNTLGLKTVLWSKDTIDWRDKDESLCLRRATEGVKGGELILMHPMAHTVKALPKILEYYKNNALIPIPVGENLTEVSG